MVHDSDTDIDPILQTLNDLGINVPESSQRETPWDDFSIGVRLEFELTFLSCYLMHFMQ